MITPRVFPRPLPKLACRRSWTTVATVGNALRLDALNASFPYVWLRDSCQSPDCIHPSTQQKLHRSSDVSLDVKPDSVSIVEDRLEIKWNDGHQSHFDSSFLRRHASQDSLTNFHRDIQPLSWDASQVSNEPHLSMMLEDLNKPSGLLNAIEQILKSGLLFVTGVPTFPTDDANCRLRNLAERFSLIRQTFYGEVWDVKNVPNSRNIAYTNLFLNMHMDLLYFQHPPRYQILHCLQNRVKGGESLFVDSFHAATTLRKSDPRAFSVLSSTPVPFHYINDSHHLHCSHPTIELSRSSVQSSEPDIVAVNYSPPFQAPLPVSTPPEFYQSLAKFAAILDEPQNVYQYRLNEGDAVIFDNRRVLHARAAFEEIPRTTLPGQTNRWLKGTYIEGDKLLDQSRVLRQRLYK